MSKRVLLAGLYHATNTFLKGRSSLEDFKIRRGEEMLRVEDNVTSLIGLLEVAQEKGWELLPILDVRAIPGATVADSVVDLFWAEFRAITDAEAAEGVDGVFLVLHGAMVSESFHDVEGEILRRIRGIEHLADAPICGVFDLHANFTEAMARQSDGLISCRTNPPTDARECATEAALLLDGLMEVEESPVTVWEHPPIMWTPEITATDYGSMLTLEERAREIEDESPDVLAVNVLAGFPYADIPEAGLCFSAITNGDLELSRSALRELNVIASSLRWTESRVGMTLEEAMFRLDEHQKGPVLLVEPSDDIGSGAPGENTHLLRAFVERGVQDAGLIIQDAEAVRSLQDASPGEHQALTIGGKSGELGSEPLTLEVELVSTSDGRFVIEDRQSPLASMLGEEIDMGPCIVIRHEGVTVLLTSHRTPPFDLGQWRSQGVDPEELFAIGIKASVEHKRAYDPIARASYTVNLPGPCPQDLSSLPYERVRRPIYPVDEL
ncbi:MAG: M81 family metallopeptidase [Rubrobacteraceae bacterium]